ncbi:hypothetical protein TNCV_1758651 [Trichonephila clavipes]|nr:hypothetical protein TNCV_1758651 [Trichonephila clavipes]
MCVIWCNFDWYDISQVAGHMARRASLQPISYDISGEILDGYIPAHATSSGNEIIQIADNLRLHQIVFVDDYFVDPDLE